MYALFVAAIIIIIALQAMQYRYYQLLLDGYWDSSEAFCSRSGIASAEMYLGDGHAYLLMDTLNKCVKISLWPCPWDTLTSDVMVYDVEFGEDVSPLPQRCQMRVSMRQGMLGLFVDDTLYLELYKNNKATSNVF